MPPDPSDRPAAAVSAPADASDATGTASTAGTADTSDTADGGRATGRAGRAGDRRDTFDAFYAASREVLLVQCYALTGDLASSRRAVRDAFVVGWHHWRKLDRRAAVLATEEAGSQAADRTEAWTRHVEESIRPHAWRLAQRRHTARLWHRDRDVDPEVRATLDALAKLTAAQRRAVVLTQFARVTMAQMAREVGLPADDAARELQTGTSQLALARGVPTVGVPALLTALADSVTGAPPAPGSPAPAPGTSLEDVEVPADDAVAVAMAAAAAAEPALATSPEGAGRPGRSGGRRVRWPRASIVRRAGATRRRTHTALGAAAAVALLLGAGALVTDTDGVRPTLVRVADRAVHDRPTRATAPTLPRSSLLGADLVAAEAGDAPDALPGRGWAVSATDDNSAGTGLVLPCQQRRYADPDGDAALVRLIEPSPTSSSGAKDPKGPRGTVGSAAPRSSVVQFTEASATTRAARTAYDTTVGWLGGCTTGEVQLLATRTPQGVGDDAVQFSLRSWADPATTYVVGVARTGVYTTTTMTERTGRDVDTARGRNPQPDADLLAASVGRLCALPDGGACASGSPTLVARDPVSAGAQPGLLLTADLPPVVRDDAALPHRWTGAPPAALAGGDNLAATTCDRTSFSGAVGGKAPRGTQASFSHVITRTFLVDGAKRAKLPATFGVVETAAALPAQAATAFVSGVEARVAGCPKKYLGSEVTRIGHDTSGLDGQDASLSAWRITVSVSDKEKVTYVMAVVRRGAAVAQLTFLPGGRADLPDDDFVALAERAEQRLAFLPAPAGH